MANEWLGSTSAAWGTASNWSSGSVPVAGETVVFNHRATQGVDGSNQAGILLAAIYVYQGFSFNVGNETQPMQVGFSILQGGLKGNAGGEGNGPTRVNLDGGTNSFLATILDTGQTTDTNLENYRLKGTHTNNSLFVAGGLSVGVATNNISETACVNTLAVSGGRVNLGAGVTWTNATLSGDANVTILGSLNATSSFLTVAGEARVVSEGVFPIITVASVVGGTWVANHRASSGNEVGTLTLNGGTLDISENPETFGVTVFSEVFGTLDTYHPGQFTASTVTLSNGSGLVRNVSLS